MRALSNVVLPDPVPPETRMLRRDRNTRSCFGPHVFGECALLHEIIRRERPLAKAPHGDSNVRTGGRNADGNPRSVIEPSIDNGRGCGVQPQRTGDMDSGPFQRRRV